MTVSMILSFCMDSMQKKLLSIYTKNLELRTEREHQQVVLAINRSDYMMDQPSNRLLQVHRYG